MSQEEPGPKPLLPKLYGGDHSLVQTVRQGISQWLDRHAVPEPVILVSTALVVGLSAGLVAVFFRYLIETVQWVAYQLPAAIYARFEPFHLMLVPALGGLMIAPLIYRFAREARGSGIPEVMEAVALRGGRIRPRVAVVKALASSICIGTGGSVGREGPIVQIGSSLGSTLGQLLKLSDERIRNLVACGAAGGIAATFNAPIAGSLFALEVVLGQFHAGYFGAVVISAVTADVIAHLFENNQRAFTVSSYSLISPWELLLYAGLGLLAGLAGVAFVKLLYLSEDLWSKIEISDYFKPALGGLALGVVGISTFKIDGFPRIYGVGYSTISQTLFGQLPVYVTLLLLFLKMLGTMITLGSGGSGGVFAPSLFMGAMLGSTFGEMANQLFPAITAPPGAYALVGMAAFVSGTAHAPVTAILILFEMTGDYRIILPLMLATVISTLVAQTISRDSVYTAKLSRRGVHLERGQDIDVLQGVTVGEAMNTQYHFVNLATPLKQLSNAFAQTHHHGLPVVDDRGHLAGVVSIQDMDRALAAGDTSGKTVADIATTEGLMVAYPHEPVGEALRRLGTRDLSVLPVLEREGSRRLVGILRRRNIIRAYNYAMVKRAQRQHQIETLRLENLDNTDFVQIEIPPESPVIGHRLSKVKLPGDCLVVSVRRGRKLHVAHGYTVLQPNDRLTVFAHHKYLSHIRHLLTGSLAGDLPLEHPQARHHEFTVPPGAACDGLRVQELPLPDGCILVSIQRGEQMIVPHGNTTLKSGDVIELFGLEDDLQEAQQCLSG